MQKRLRLILCVFINFYKLEFTAALPASYFKPDTTGGS